MKLNAEYLAVILYVIDRVIELYEKRNMTRDEIVEALPGEIEEFLENRKQMDQEIEEGIG